MSYDAAIIELEASLAIQKKVFLQNQYPSLQERQRNVGKIAEMVLRNRDPIREALKSDFGNHPTVTTDLMEVLGVAGRAGYVASQIEKWMVHDDRDVDTQLFGAGKAQVRYQPKGVVGIISPWNFPFDLSLGPLCEVLAAGNRAIIKPSEFTPAVGALLAKMISETFPADLVTVLNGGLDLSKRFSKQKFNHILYTGNPSVGALVMGEAAKNLVPVTLELGGKCPAIMTPGTVTQANVEHILGTKLLKNGQMCISIDYVLLPESGVDNFVLLAKQQFEKLADYATSPDNTGIISKRHLERITKLIADAEAAGVQSIQLGGDAVAQAHNVKRQLPLTLLLRPSATLDVMKEEIFGPILPLIPYSLVDSALTSINEGKRPLGLYVFSDDATEIERIINNTNSGGVGVNSCAVQGALPSLGFGGSGNSGMGRHHGIEGFREFSNPRGVFIRAPGNQDMIAALAPPFAGMGEAVAEGAYQQAYGDGKRCGLDSMLLG